MESEGTDPKGHYIVYLVLLHFLLYFTFYKNLGFDLMTKKNSILRQQKLRNTAPHDNEFKNLALDMLFSYSLKCVLLYSIEFSFSVYVPFPIHLRASKAKFASEPMYTCTKRPKYPSIYLLYLFVQCRVVG